MASDEKDPRHSILEVYLAEYMVLREEFQFYQDAKARLLNYVIVALVALPTVLFGLLQAKVPIDSMGLILLILPLPFIAVCAAYIGYIMNQIAIARYTYKSWAPEVRQLVHSNQDLKLSHLMGWWDYWESRAIFNNLARAVGEFSVLFLPIIGSLCVFFVMVIEGLIVWRPEYAWLIVLDALAILGLASLIWLSFRAEVNRQPN